MPGGRWIARCDPRRDRVERVDLSLPGLLVAGAGRLGRCLGAERARGTAVAWLYLCTTLVPTVAVIPASWVHSGLAWRLCAGAAGPLAILTLALAHGYAAPALDRRRRCVTGTGERAMLREGFAAARTVRAARRRPDRAVVDQALWELAGALVTIERARTAQRRMAAALTCPTGDGTLAGDLRCRHALLSRVRRRARAEALHHLATLCALADTGAPDGRPP